MFLGLLPLVTPAFGADAILAPSHDLDAWHHRRLTLLAAREAGWSEAAAQELARHADGIDRMLFNPVWIAAGGPRRIWGSAVGRWANEQIHFDDLTSPGLVAAAWERYLGGARCALRWAATHPRTEAVAIVRCAVGLTLHAVQDFYAHSTWIDDPARRDITWQEAEGAHADLRTGTWALPATPRHGGFGLRSRERPIPVELRLRGRCVLPRGVAGASAGITLDSRWQAPIAVRERGIELDGDAAFACAATLALRSSRQVLDLLAADAAALGDDVASLWDEASGGAAHPDPIAALEDPALMPQPFLAAGAAPGVEPDRDAWFVRVGAAGPHASRWSVGGRATWFGPLRRLPRRAVPSALSAVAFRRGRAPEVVLL